MVNAITFLLIPLLIVSCCTNVVFLEHMIKVVPSSGNMINFFQFAFIASEGLIFHSRFFTTKRVIPIRNYVTMVILFFSSSVTNMMALNCNIPMPLHMIFKSGSLVANMLMGYFVLGKKYDYSKVVSVVLVSIGICISTLASQTKPDESEMEISLEMMKGIGFMILSLIISARLGVYQETVFKEYGKENTREAAFYNHIIPLPLYSFLAPSILKTINEFNSTPAQPVPFVNSITGEIPVLWQYLAINLITQYICIRSVFRLSAEISSLSLTLLVTLRKFVSLAISVVYFGNYFGTWHLCGAFSVFVGTLIYTGLLPTPNFGRKKKVE